MNRSRFKFSDAGIPVLVTLAAVLATLEFRLAWQWQPWIVWVDLFLTALASGCLAWGTTGASRTASPRLRTWRRLPGWRPWCAAGLIALPLLLQPWWRFYASGDPAEIVLLLMLQNAALVAAVAPTTVPPGRTLLLSGFLLLFVTFVHGSLGSWLLAGLALSLVLWWLMSRYWSQVSRQAASGHARRMPSRLLVLASSLCLLGLAAGVALWSTTSWGTRSWGELFPTSGGTTGADDYARDGIGAGELVTAGVDQAETVAPIDTELYLSSDQPSLYDMISEVYGKPTRQNDMKIDVSQNIDDSAAQARFQETAASRTLTTVREPRAKPRVSLTARESTALLFVSGPVPLHLRQATFERFDGLAWHAVDDESEPESVGPALALGTDWMSPANRSQAGLSPGETEQHELKIVNLNSPTVPTPPRMEAWKIPRVNRPEFYAWSASGILRMPGRARIPSSTVIHMQSRVGQRGNLLERIQFPPVSSAGSPAEMSTRWSALARQLTADCATPWERVERIETWLRRSCEWDPLRVPSRDCQDVVEAFLQQGGGPDYLFATAASQMLRAVGIPSRLVTGFYADQRHFDRRSRQTIVWKENLHSWLEVCVAEGQWEPVEPTPGFARPRRTMSWGQWSLWTAGRILRWLGRNWLCGCGALLLVGAGLWFRWALLDLATLAVWRGATFLPGVNHCRLGLRLLAIRAAAAGCRRPPGETWRNWLRRYLPQSLPGAGSGLVWVDRQLYGTPNSSSRAAGQKSAVQNLTRLFDVISARRLVRLRRARCADPRRLGYPRPPWESTLVTN